MLGRKLSLASQPASEGDVNWGARASGVTTARQTQAGEGKLSAYLNIEDSNVKKRSLFGFSSVIQ